MTRAPEVLYRHRNGRMDTEVTDWSPTDTRPLADPGPPRPLHHLRQCWWCKEDGLVEVCRCTRQQRAYRDRHPGGGGK